MLLEMNTVLSECFQDFFTIDTDFLCVEANSSEEGITENTDKDYLRREDEKDSH